MTDPANYNPDRYEEPIRQSIEYSYLDNAFKKHGYVTLSFLFKASSSGTYSVSLRRIIAGDLITYVHDYTYNAGDVKRVVLTIPAPPDPTGTVSINSGWVINFVSKTPDGISAGLSGTDQWTNGNYVSSGNITNWYTTRDNWVAISEPQLEPGRIATLFENIPYDVELQRCMRYYERIDYESSNRAYDTGYYWQIASFFRVRKRVIPSISASFSQYTPYYNPDKLSTDYVLFTELKTNHQDTFWIVGVTADSEVPV